LGGQTLKPRYTPGDANQSPIKAALLQIPGVSVIDLREVGGGCPDLLVGYNLDNYLIELKTAKGKLRPEQTNHFETWGGQTAVCRSLDDVLKVIGL